MVADKKGKERLHLIKCGGKTHNGSVPVAEHTSKSLGINALYGILSVLHHHLDETHIKFNIIGDPLCSAKLYREGVKSTIKISSNTRVQKEQLIQLSKSFRNSTVTVYWVPSAANLADALTKISKNPVKLANGEKYRHGSIMEGLEYIEVHQNLLKDIRGTPKILEIKIFLILNYYNFTGLYILASAGSYLVCSQNSTLPLHPNL